MGLKISDWQEATYGFFLPFHYQGTQLLWAQQPIPLWSRIFLVLLADLGRTHKPEAEEVTGVLPEAQKDKARTSSSSRNKLYNWTQWVVSVREGGQNSFWELCGNITLPGEVCTGGTLQPSFISNGQIALGQLTSILEKMLQQNLSSLHLLCIQPTT